MGSGITLYTVGTPNGQKASIALEELKEHYNLEYKHYAIDFDKNEQKAEWFLKINPNGKIPAIVDHNRGDFAVFESGAILLYLVEHYDPEHVLFPEEANEKSEVIQWIMWQMAGLGPMQAQATYFSKFATEKVPFAIDRFKDECHRLYAVLEKHLSSGGRKYIAADRFTIADICSFGWIAGHYVYTGLTLKDYPHEINLPLLFPTYTLPNIMRTHGLFVLSIGSFVTLTCVLLGAVAVSASGPQRNQGLSTAQSTAIATVAFKEVLSTVSIFANGFMFTLFSAALLSIAVVAIPI
ncbi:glutathione S-transferase [Rhizoclosmatium globosum]|uniref:Glutathione S-transferase n=1 Tax=Rhizoclosmatium globosum TaxID=329046 RepID=A0A1Y2CFQ3_9FUNG|nr:glutathione S-transferase [Rhizoclosmatium globosum]|eukprot:ORY45880.1 glutathione S-transferase [Rhizoclosmatium globosum]